MYCRNNWMTFDFGNGVGNCRARSGDFAVQFNERADRVYPLNEIAQQTAREIHSLYPNIYVAMSGGCDSEYVAKSFKAAGVPFKAIMMTCKSYFKIGEWYADKWCKENEVELIKFEVDPFDLLDHGKRVIGKVKGSCWFGATVDLVAKEIESRGGYMVHGAYPMYWPDPKMQPEKASKEFKDSFRGFMIGEAEFYIELMNPGKHPWAFFFWSPEMLASAIADWDTSQPMEENKWRMFNLLPRPKLNGGEGFVQNYIAKTIPAYNEIFKWTQAHVPLQWSNRDFTPLPDKEEFLKLLLNDTNNN